MAFIVIPSNSFRTSSPTLSQEVGGQAGERGGGGGRYCSKEEETDLVGGVKVDPMSRMT